ncbi:hypothetical protein [Pseudomonas sp. NFIX28]|jgi:hypothetical protein|uniref:hypothetical protein n=1 Tax=Pseudomonas sp. NFIX28 TaxID=1566235 RepID=UPI0008950605|nr:hypothetical protein [Pseudomonas sp. NFIX28]SDY40404.1 hypothetical protein SAMN03159453_00513 [Pseudomonas sp. NFIX28]
MNLSRVLSLLCCLLVLPGCFENTEDKGKDTSKSSVQMTQPDSDQDDQDKQ